MANIIYGIQGEGRGHSSRSKIIIEHLIKNNHNIKIFTSKNAYNYLKPYFKDIENIQGLEFIYENQSINIKKTLKTNIKNLLKNSKTTIKQINKEIKEFKPDLAITDFEPFIPFISKLNNIPYISINHQHLIAHCSLDYPKEWKKDFLYAFTVTNNMYWFAKKYFVTSFYFPKVKFKRTKLIKPILRKEVLEQKPTTKNHILVYVTTKENKKIMKILKKSQNKFIIYGFKKKSKNNLIFKKASTKGFLKDLAESKAVITNGGYTLMSEALFFKKPIYSLPLKNQFEQMLNAHYLEKLGYGLYDLEPSKERIKEFLNNLDKFKNNIKKHNFNGNKEFFKILDKEIKTFKSPKNK